MYLTQEQLEQLLNKQDLTEQPNHCVAIIVDRIREKLEKKYSIKPSIARGTKIVSAHDNYYALGYVELPRAKARGFLLRWKQPSSS